MHRVLLVTSALIFCVACQGEKAPDSSKSEPEPTSGAVASSEPVLDSKIANAVANAAKRAAPNAQASDQGPPADGILGAERADAELKIGAAPKLTLGGTGSEPRLQLGGPLPTQARIGQSELSLRTGASMLPTTAFKFEFEPTKPSEATVQPALRFEVVGADLGSNQPGQIPQQMVDELRKLKGSWFQFEPGEVLRGTPAFELAKGANPQLDTMMQGAAAGLVEALPALPSEPVGVGAFWMVTSRETLLGTDVVAYRMVKVSEIKDNQQAVLDITTKRYLAAGGVGLPGVDQAPVKQFQAESSTQLTMPVGERLPLDGRTQTSLRALVEREGNPLPVQVEMRWLFAFPTQAQKK